MSYVTGRIDSNGAVVDVLVDVSRPRRRLLVKHNLPIPHSVHVRAQIDTGSSISGFASRVFAVLQIPAVGKILIATPSTSPDSPHRCDLYDVTLSIVANGRANPFGDTRVMESDCWLPDEGIEALIGRDILSRCYFQYVVRDETFTLAF
jgi:hypothetical protein